MRIVFYIYSLHTRALTTGRTHARDITKRQDLCVTLTSLMAISLAL